MQKYPEEKNTYLIDDKKVAEGEFKAFLALLKGQEDWSCSDANYGGVVSYKSKDVNGNTYVVELESGGKNEQRITKLN